MLIGQEIPYTHERAGADGGTETVEGTAYVYAITETMICMHFHSHAAPADVLTLVVPRAVLDPEYAPADAPVEHTWFGGRVATEPAAGAPPPAGAPTKKGWL